ncbi:MAG: META domain-containing protein [Chloroflexota bacterium]
MRKFNPTMIILVILLSGLTACTSQPAEQNDPGDENQNDELNLGMPDSSEEGDAEEIIAEIDITGTSWQWLRFESSSADENILVGDPSRYTLLLNEDGSYNATVDCNQARGSYTRESNLIAFEPGPITRAMCPPDSLDSAYLAFLFSAADFTVESEHLVLNLADGGGKLIFAPAPVEQSDEITEITWQWIRFDDTAGLNNIVIADPTLYTLTLNPDGSYAAKADCNHAAGGYTLEGSSLTLLPGITTLAECGPDSHYNTFLTLLGEVASYLIQDGQLYLNLWADGGSMVFTPAE